MQSLDIGVELQNIKLYRATHTVATTHDEEACWVVMIRELVDVADYTYSRIARRIQVSASTIQKLATQPKRKPRQSVFYRLLCLYYRVFYGPYRSSQVVCYLEQQACPVLSRIPTSMISEM